ncbi:hypothetical protein HMPREF3192_00071 [Atopobium deltae]|uniref:Uncharacterized protein n=1 Tax=Atopobium deltae TaxID=1393034 RepID=A0A133XXJ5_9ACTN|nr:hypothetical protein HMPREF3192_00071 [Atopobium deltae]
MKADGRAARSSRQRHKVLRHSARTHFSSVTPPTTPLLCVLYAKFEDCKKYMIFL